MLFSTDGGNAFKITSKLQNNKVFITEEIPCSQQKYTKNDPTEHQVQNVRPL
ncbi:hypothetical protein Cp87MAT_0412 [Corynebacterium pseudotuberculosis]|nr:hypothetical protein CPTC_00271 [Corynebacterium pseudotuberculosis]AKC73143.1 Hypothetical protein Cp226_0401 [Corynebacterium pseudotuberculosis]ARS59916.1 Hypothetical protein CpATCC19410_0423 [Corynebacterium pseudotuberculosis]AUY57689.1 Hypothetical protein CpCAPJ4_00389 [Corynebacterium pseudotuberculosis]QBB98855.1 hypothetical protein Cp87MAT_0412 [Corynebacterium pseudotuberculosis]